jgi:hypothetical protein
MKFLIIPMLASLLTVSSPDIRLVTGKRSDFSIVIASGSDSLTSAAAVTLRDYLFKISGAKIPVISNSEEDGRYIFIGMNSIKDPLLKSKISEFGDEEFIIRTSAESIFLGGKTGVSNFNAAVTFLEEYLGCMKFTGTEEFIPSNDNISLAEGEKTIKPAFTFRHPHFMDRQNKEYLSWHKLNSFDNWGLYVHTFQKLCPQEKYFDTHPEFFSFVNGKRIRDGQLCLSNPEVIKLLGDNLAELMAQQPVKKYWSVSQNDCINFCECDNCKKLYQKYGNVSGAYIEMANKLAERFPDKQISTLAYQFTRQAPVNIVPLPNVNIMFCSIECNRSMPLATDPRSAGFVADMQAWEKISNNIYVWDYVVQFKTYLCPFPNFHVLKPNIQFFRDHNGAMMFQQGSGNQWSDMGELKQYLISKLLWNPEVNTDSVINRFIDKYYGPASEYIAKYQSLADSIVEANQEKWGLDIYGLPSFYFKTYLTGSLLKNYRNLMDMAEKSVQNDSLYLKIVLRTRSAVDFAYIDYALNAGDPDISFIDKKGADNSLNKNMAAYLDRFISDCRVTGITNIGEEKLTVIEYRDHIMTILNLAVIRNKADGKEIKSLTAFNPRYSNPGVNGLTDGIFGGRHFNSGWLGYEGEDMVVVIDLGKKETIHAVSMNFLRDFVSWIFLPDEVKIELSDNGTNYKKVASISNVITDRRFGVEPVYHNLGFEPKKTRYVKITAQSMKKCPDWHRGSGMPSWIFCDEIIIE